MKLAIRTTAVLLASLGLLVVAGSRAAATAGAAPAINTAPMASDGVRYFAYMTPRRIPVVLDTWRRETNPIRNAKGCQPLDVGGSRVLLTCGKADKEHMRTTKTASARGGKARRLPHNKSGFWNSIGRYWVEGNAPCTGTGGCLAGRVYVNWRTGKIDSPKGIPGNFDEANLERPKLRYRSPAFIPAGFANTWKVCWAGEIVVTDTGRIRVWRNRHRSVVIGTGDNLRSGCNSFGGLRIGSGKVTWNRGRVIHAYNAVTGMDYSRRLANPTKIVPVRDGAVVAMKVRDGTKQDRYRIRFVTLP
ncbi:MAG: hypothetical protein KDB48_03105 [Solirubrobacterales bacterium]|nr:hypothetical protein [Solirubrobacterales bacterium]HMT05592.1 hypothetical protein [Solirubrobacterales bacterium]